MKPKSNPFLTRFALAGVSLALGTSAQADQFDLNGAATGFGVADATTYDWWATNAWAATASDTGAGSGFATWVNGTRGALFVGAGTGTTYTVRLGGAGSTATTLQNLALNVNAAANAQMPTSGGNVTIGNAGDTGILTLNAANSVATYGGTLTVNNGINLNAFTTFFRGGTVVINGNISGTGASNISSGGSALGYSTGPGTLTLAGNNSFAGNVTAASGFIISLQHANALGATGGTNTVSSGGTMEVANGVTIGTGESVTISGAGVSATSIGALRAGTGGGTWTGGVTLGDGSARLGATTGNTLTVTGAITGSFPLTISGQGGTGVVILNPATSNAYTGATNIVRGILRLGKTDALPTGTTLDVDSASSVSDGATFDLASFNQTVAALQDSAGTNINGVITNSVASTTSTLTVNQATNTTYDGIIQNGSGLVVLTKSGAGNLTLNGANAFTGGTNIQNGKIVIGGGNDRLATGSSVTLGSVSNTGVLVLGDGTNARNQTLASLTTTGLGGAVVGNAAANSTLTLNIAGTNAFGGTLGGGATNENNLALTKSGAGTLNLSNANTYSGTTTLTAGTIQLGAASVGSVGAITSSAIGTGGLSFNGGTLSSDSTTARTILNAVTFTGSATLGNATNNGKLTFGAGLDLGAAARTITVNSEVQLDGSFSNAAATSGLTKAGAGTLTINAANTSFGNTNGFLIIGGTVVAANTAAMGNAGQIVTLSSSGGLGTLDLATDTTANAYVLNFGSVAGAGGNVIVNRATSGAAITHTMGTATLGNAKVNVTAGSNVTSGTPTLQFGGIVLSAGSAGDGATTLNPTTANILVSGAITRTGTSANSLVLDGTSSGNLISGSISGPQTLTKSNTGTWELSNANTFTGNTRVTGGTLKLTNNLALQSSAFDTSGAGTLDTSTIDTPTFGGLTSAANFALSSNITSLTLNPGSGTQTYTGNLSRTGGGVGLTLTKTGAGTQILGGTNSYTGLTTVGTLGELQITSAGAIGGTDVTVASGGQLTLNGGITVAGKTLTTSGGGRAAGVGAFLGGLQSVSGINEWAGDVILGADLSRVGARKDATLVISGGVDDGLNTFGMIVRNEGFGTGRNGAGNAGTVTVLSGASTYGGSTTLVQGLTKLDGGDNRLPVGTILQFGLSNTNAKFDMNGRNQELAGLAVTSTGTDANRDWNANELTNSSATLSTLNVNTATNQSFGGTLTNNVGIITGNIALEKSGAARLTLSGTNTYTGATTVSAGTLFVTGALSNSAVTVGAAGTVGGTGTLGNGLSILAGGKLDLTGVTLGANSTGILGITGGTLTLGALTFADLIGWDAANADIGTYELIDGSFTVDFGGTLYTNAANAYDFGNGKLGYFTAGSLTAVIIPEPNAAALLGALGTLLLLRRRRAA